jgi:hypothetical protein
MPPSGTNVLDTTSTNTLANAQVLISGPHSVAACCLNADQASGSDFDISAPHPQPSPTPSPAATLSKTNAVPTPSATPAQTPTPSPTPGPAQNEPKRFEERYFRHFESWANFGISTF